MAGDEKKRPAALNFTPNRSASTDSSSSTSSLAKPPRTPRFAEATTVHSPVDSGDSEDEKRGAPGDVGFGYISEKNTAAARGDIPAAPKSPLKSALKVPGTPATMRNPLSPTFREEEILEKREKATEIEQARDLVC